MAIIMDIAVKPFNSEQLCEHVKCLELFLALLGLNRSWWQNFRFLKLYFH